MRFLHSFSLRLFSDGLVVAAALGNQTLISRVLGPKGKGHYALLSTTVRLLVVVFGEALARSNPYFVGRDPKKLAPLSTNALCYGMAVVFFLSGIFLGGARFSLWPDAGGPSVLWLLAFWVAALTVLYRGLHSLFLGLERMGPYNVLPVVFALAYLIGNGIALKGLDKGLAGVMASWLFAGILTFLLTFWLGSFIIHHDQLIEHGNLIIQGDYHQRNIASRNLKNKTVFEKLFHLLTHGDTREHVLHHTAVAVYSRPFPGKVPMPADAVYISLKDYAAILWQMVTKG